LILKKRILICVAHSDDETIGCGGAISHHVKIKDKVYCIYMTNGVGARHFKIKDNLINQRKKNSTLASKILGFKWLFDFCGDFPDNGMDKVKLLEVVRIIEKAKKKIRPHIIYTHHPYDLNVDHRVVAEATLTAFRPKANEIWEKILAFEIPSSTDFAYFNKNKNFYPNYFIDIRKFWKKKKQALLAYKKEIKKFPNSRSLKGIEILSKFRGLQNGMSQAEAFQILKELIR
jgi:LmbE family N-acetylglucosaminyl deacetylase